jgi:hypothetical protein
VELPDSAALNSTGLVTRCGVLRNPSSSIFKAQQPKTDRTGHVGDLAFASRGVGCGRPRAGFWGGSAARQPRTGWAGAAGARPHRWFLLAG